MAQHSRRCRNQPAEKFNGRLRMKDRDMSDHDKTLSRRTLVQALAAGAGAMVAGAGTAAAQPGRTGGAAEHHHHPAARLRPEGRADDLFLGPRRHRGRPELQRPRAAERADPAAVDRRAVGRRAGVERAGALSRVERHSEQPADALARRTTAASACSARPRTTATATRSTSRAGSSPASISRAAWCATSTTAPSTVIADAFNGKKLNSPNDVVPHPDGSYWFTDPPYGGQLYEGEPDVAGGPSNAARPAQSAHRPAGRLRARPARAADQLLSRRSERAHRSGRQRGPGARSERALLLARLQEALRRVAPARGRATPARAARATSTCSTSAPTTSCRTTSCSPTAWSTA